MNIQRAIAHVIAGNDLLRSDMQQVIQQIMTGQCTDAQIGGFLIGLRVKGETVEEITAAAEVMASLASHVNVDASPLVDIVGTGGDKTSTFNISTVSSFVAAGAGAKVAKHGNRSVSSKSGSADLLEQAGANLSLTSEQVAKVIEQAGTGFMFAPMHHSAMKHTIGPRKEMAVRTIFNVLGPLTNPAQVKHQLVGVFERDLTITLASVFKQLGSKHAMVVHSDDGMDEISIATPTQVSELKDGVIKTYSIAPENYGLERASIEGIVANDAAESLAIIESVLEGSLGAARDIVLLNAGAAIYVAGLAATMSEGVQIAIQSIDTGKAKAAMRRYLKTTNEVA